MGNKKQKGYDAEAVKLLAKSLQDLRRSQNYKMGTPSFEVDLEGLERAIKVLPKNDRENIEKFWGLTGGINHSEKKVSFEAKDIALAQMRRTALNSRNLLQEIEYIVMYNTNAQKHIEFLVHKIDKCGIEISDIEAIKYVMAFIMFIFNGPKMSFEDDPLKLKFENSSMFVFDSYAMLEEVYIDLKIFPDKSIKLKLLIDLLEYYDFMDWVAMKQSMRINISKDDQEYFKKEEVEVLKTLTQIRRFKERIFPYGPWNVSSVLILGDPEGEIDFEAFMEELEKIQDWKIEKYKTRQETVKLSNGFRTFDVYNIGGLEFTDPDEIRFLYLERNFIAAWN